jgi:ferredoxin
MMEKERSYQVIIRSKGWNFCVAEGESLLAAALRSGIRLPSSCRNGTCRACMCRCIAGTVTYNIAWPGLSMEEKAESWILPCVASPESDLIIEVPLASRIEHQG